MSDHTCTCETVEMDGSTCAACGCPPAVDGPGRTQDWGRRTGGAGVARQATTDRQAREEIRALERLSRY